MNRLCLTKIFTMLLPFFLLVAVSIPVSAAKTQNVSESEEVEEVIEFTPEEKAVVKDEKVIGFIAEEKCDLNNHAAVSVENTTKTLIAHFDVLDTPQKIDIVINPKSEKHFCLQHGHILSIFTVNKKGVRVSDFADVRQLLPSAKHLTIKVIYNKETKRIEYDLELDTHKR